MSLTLETVRRCVLTFVGTGAGRGLARLMKTLLGKYSENFEPILHFAHEVSPVFPIFKRTDCSNIRESWTCLYQHVHRRILMEEQLTLSLYPIVQMHRAQYGKEGARWAFPAIPANAAFPASLAPTNRLPAPFSKIIITFQNCL